MFWDIHGGALVCLCREGGLYLGWKQGSRDESCCQIILRCSEPESLQLFFGLTDFTTGMQSKTVHSKTAILRIPGCNTHMQRWSHRSAHDWDEKRNMVFIPFPSQNRPSSLCSRQRCTMTYFIWLLYRTFKLLVWRSGGGVTLNYYRK